MPPSITSIAGSFDHGSAITITGADFGTHVDSHADADKIIKMWDDFETNDFLNPYENWGVTLEGTSVDVVTDTSRHGRSSIVFERHRKSANNLGFITHDLIDEPEYFFSVWVKFGTWNLPTSGNFQWKGPWRVRANNNNRNFYPGWKGDNGFFHMNWESVDPFVPSGGGAQQLALSDTPSTSWARWDWYMKKASTASANDGVMTLWVDQVAVYDRSDFDSDGSDIDKNCDVGNFLASDETASFVRFDDYYHSNTRARVELIDTSTYAARTTAEIQIPTAWATGEITCTVNAGAFNDGDTAYLYVVDSNDAVNASGFEVTVGEEEASLVEAPLAVLMG